MGVACGVTGYRVTCDAVRCSAVLGECFFLTEEDFDDIPIGYFAKTYPPIDEAGHRLCEVHLERWHNNDPDVVLRPG